MVLLLANQSGISSKKINLELTYNPEIPFLDGIPERTENICSYKTLVHKYS